MKKLFCILSCLLLVFSFTACAQKEADLEEYVPKGTVKQLNAEFSVERDSAILNDDEIMSAYNAFSADFFSTCYALDAEKDEYNGENIMISPLSMFMCYSLAFNGANGATLSEFESAFHLDKQTAKNLSSAFIKHFAKDFETAKLEIANSIWINNQFDQYVKEDYLNDATKYFNSEIYSAPFNDATVGEINDWVSKKTDKMIDKIIERLDTDTVLAIINSLLLESQWTQQFEDYQIKQKNFTAYDSSVKSVDFLTCSGWVFFETDEATAFCLTLKDGFEFWGILPKDGVSIDSYIKNLNGEKLEALIKNSVTGYDVNIAFPKFKFDYQTDLTEVMKKMGLTTSLNKNEADFKGLMEIPQTNVFISSAIQKSAIEVDENGLKAAAVTAITMDKATSMPIEKQVKNIILDRPFAFAICANGSLDTNVSQRIPMFLGSVQSV